MTALDDDIDDLDAELEELFDPRSEITKVIYSCNSFRLELLIQILLDCGLALAANNETVITTEDRYMMIKSEIEDRNGKEPPMSYTMLALGTAGACYDAWKKNDKDKLSALCYKLLSGLKEYDHYWMDRALGYMEHIDAN